MPRIAELIALTPGQALYVVDRLRKDRRISDADIRRYLRALAQEIEATEHRLRALREALGTATPVPLPASQASRARGPRRRRHSAAGRLGLRFSGLIRHLPARIKAQLKALRSEHGIDAAITAAVAAGAK